MHADQTNGWIKATEMAQLVKFFMHKQKGPSSETWDAYLTAKCGDKCTGSCNPTTRRGSLEFTASQSSWTGELQIQ